MSSTHQASHNFLVCPSFLQNLDSPKDACKITYFKNTNSLLPKHCVNLGRHCSNAELDITFSEGTVSLINNSWKDLTEDAYMRASKNSMWMQDHALQGGCNTMTIVNLLEHKMSRGSREECHQQNHLVKAKEDHHVASTKSMEKIALVNHKHGSQISQQSSLPVDTHFSLSSKSCLENGWIFQHPYSKWEILKWKAVPSIAVKRLQVAIIQM
ncbi:uncharacterized protein LOC129009278 isoform X2 [Pongo pygmaeus]|uniref:uncharacterized protein LOC129009278 isoform X2 n=1 Tax=Pongo pygmaeus TaxID=9600 RepID=UPI0023E09A84|nr:uncharacterized protein LOC129009278 isoform X2 [Pongo pygmaeus]XP_054297916.1 uncharacterized protein LOC129009278 isoform X2 [Pongo pygmaeus]